MQWHNTLTGTSIGTGLVGVVAEVAAELPPRVSWAFVLMTAIPAVTLALRLGYTLAIRMVESRERMAMIKAGMPPPPLPPFAPETSKASNP